jgi:hypothetical protein
LLTVTIFDAVNNTRLLGLRISWFALLPAVGLLIAGIFRRENKVYLVVAAGLILAECGVIDFVNGVARGGAAVIKLM